MARETPDVAEPAEDRPACPDCGHLNIPSAAFCARCGRSLTDDDTAADGEGIDVTADSQATSTFEPVTSTVTPPPDSPWARPAGADNDPGLTTELPPPDYVPYRPAAEPTRRRGVRGFWLGVIAVVLILAVLAIYLYAAWLSDSARSTIEGWLPWM